MKKAPVAIAVLLASLFGASTARAEKTNFTACTKDGLTAVLTLDVKGSVTNGGDLKTLLQQAFTMTANSLDSIEWVKAGGKGFETLKANVDKVFEDKMVSEGTSFNIVYPSPMIGGPSCTPGK